MPTSAVNGAKRQFVSELLRLAKAYALRIGVNRDSDDTALNAAFKAVARKVHPDKGGSDVDMRDLLSAKEAWEKVRGSARRGRPARAHPEHPQGVMGTMVAAGTQGMVDCVLEAPQAARKFSFRRIGVLLTYFLDSFEHFHIFLREQKSQHPTWGVRRWCTTCELCPDTDRFHAHVMLQFWEARDRASDAFMLANVKPNISATDLCGDSFRGRYPQECIDRGMFYVWADKIGTVQDAAGKPVVEGNYFPCWVQGQKGRFEKYSVKGAWPEKLWKKRKLSFERCEEYIFLSRDGVISKKRNMDAVKAWELETAEKEELKATVKRIRDNPALYRPFPIIQQVCQWLEEFKGDALRYAILVIIGQSLLGKTEWAESLFSHALKLEIGTLTQFPDKMRTFDRLTHDGLVLDDVRDLKFVSDHQDKLQGKYSSMSEFGTTTGGTCAYQKWLFRMPVAITINFSTANLEMLSTHDWLSKPGNRALAVVGPVPRGYEWICSLPRAFPAVW